MKSKIVASREYKVMLRAAKFEQADVPHEGVKAFWTWLTAAVKKVGAKTEGALTKVDKRRQVRFYDTEDCFLRWSGYVLRERRKLNKGKKRQFTLKYRHPARLTVLRRGVFITDRFALLELELAMIPTSIRNVNLRPRRPRPLCCCRQAGTVISSA